MTYRLCHLTFVLYLGAARRNRLPSRPRLLMASAVRVGCRVLESTGLKSFIPLIGHWLTLVNKSRREVVAVGVSPMTRQEPVPLSTLRACVCFLLQCGLSRQRVESTLCAAEGQETGGHLRPDCSARWRRPPPTPFFFLISVYPSLRKARLSQQLFPQSTSPPAPKQGSLEKGRRGQEARENQRVPLF